MFFTGFEPLPGRTMLIYFGVQLLCFIAVETIISILLSDALKRLPPAFRQMQPAMVWLLLIPCFNFIWNFVVFTSVSNSYSTYFVSQGRTDMRGCAYTLGIVYSISVLALVIPCVGFLTAIVSVVLLYFYLKTITALKKQVSQPPQP